MWLLDHNLPAQINPILRNLGMVCETTFDRNWHELKNGQLVAASFDAGFRCIVTRDVLFGESAAKALKNYTSMAVVLIRLPQSRGRLYAQRFETEWLRQKIVPSPGSLTTWPK